MQIINKVLEYWENSENSSIPFFWVDYIPNWMSPLWFYIVVWCSVIYLTTDWKSSNRNKKILNVKSIKLGEDIYFLMFSISTYVIIILIKYDLYIYLFWFLGVIIELIIDYIDKLTTYLLEENVELDNKFSIWYKILMLWEKITNYFK